MICRVSQLVEMVPHAEVYGSETAVIDRVLTDSRSLTHSEGVAFFALSTPSGDGHSYIEDLIACGVRLYVVGHGGRELSARHPDCTFVEVADTLVALQRLAAYQRSRLSTQAEVLAITGSNGKTSVKEMLAQLLTGLGLSLYRSPASYNSQLGVALSLLGMPPETDLAVIEAGISQPGEMARLVEMIRPTTVILTGVGQAHSAHFASRAEHIREKLRLATLPECTRLICPMDDPEVAREVEAMGLADKVVRIALGASDPRARLSVDATISADATILKLTDVHGASEQYQSSLTSLADRHNLSLALAYIHLVHPELLPEVARRTPRLQPLAMRLEVHTTDRGAMIINDSYSFDLNALENALDFAHRHIEDVGEVAPVAVLSDIEGSSLPASELYRRVADLLRAYGMYSVYTIGVASSVLGEFGGLVHRHYESVESLLSSPHLEDLRMARLVLVKGARCYGLERLVHALTDKAHHTRLEVDLSALYANLRYYRSLLPLGHRITCMIKADGYGLGAYQVARLLDEAGVDSLAVAVVDEARRLRSAGIRTAIIVMNPEASQIPTIVELGLEAEVYSLSMLRAVVGYAQRYGTAPRIHIKVDSGMHRLGFALEELPEIVETLSTSPIGIDMAVFSHLAVADEPEADAFTHAQAQRLELFAHELRCQLQERVAWSQLAHPLPLHLLNTAGIERLGSVYAYDGVRLGIGLYGSSPTGRIEVQPTVRLSASILQVKGVPAGEGVGYGLRGVAVVPRRIAVVSIGYADGLPRALGEGRWAMMVRGHACPIVGRVCMDTCMIDVSHVPEVLEGDRVIVFGEGAYTLEAMAEALGTISYEVLTRLSPRVERLYLW